MDQRKILPSTGNKDAKKELIQTQRERKLDKLRTLKAEAESLKQSLTAFKTETAKDPNTKHIENDHEEELYELVVATGLSMDREVLEHIVELLRLGVNPDKLIDVFEVLNTKKAVEMEISVI